MIVWLAVDKRKEIFMNSYIIFYNSEIYDYNNARKENEIYWHDYSKKGITLQIGDEVFISDGSYLIDRWKITDRKVIANVEALHADKNVCSEYWIKDYDKFAEESEMTFLKLDRIDEDWRKCSKVISYNQGIIKIDENVSKLLEEVQ